MSLSVSRGDFDFVNLLIDFMQNLVSSYISLKYRNLNTNVEVFAFEFLSFAFCFNLICDGREGVVVGPILDIGDVVTVGAATWIPNLY